MSTSEDQATYSAAVTIVPSYDPSNPYSVLDTPTAAYDFLVLNPTQQMAMVPPRGY